MLNSVLAVSEYSPFSQLSIRKATVKHLYSPFLDLRHWHGQIYHVSLTKPNTQAVHWKKDLTKVLAAVADANKGIARKGSIITATTTKGPKARSGESSHLGQPRWDGSLVYSSPASIRTTRERERERESGSLYPKRPMWTLSRVRIFIVDQNMKETSMQRNNNELFCSLGVWSS